jgi:hypothetical protein
MWYWHTDSLYTVNAIKYTESPDGKNWYNYQWCQNGTVPIVTGSSGDWNRGSYGPCDVLYNSVAPNTGTKWKFHMYYDGTTGGSEAIGLGFSSDGITWTGYDPDDDADPVLTGDSGEWDDDYVSRATIIVEESTNFSMWYSGGDGRMDHGIGYATSSDSGLSWTKDPDNPIFHKDDEVPWRDERTYCPAVLKDGSTYKMWFAGVDDATSNYAIGYAWTTPECDGLAAYWPLNESSGTVAYDFSGNSNNADLENGPVWKPNDGKIDGALDFDGTDDYVELAGNESSGFFHDVFYERSVAMWIKAAEYSSRQILYDEGGATKGLAIRIHNNQLKGAIRNGGYPTQETVVATYKSTSWKHVAVVFDSGAFKLYIDGSRIDSCTAAYDTIGTHPDPAGLGGANGWDAFGNDDGHYFDGLIDEVYVYDIALTDSPIEDLYNEGFPKHKEKPLAFDCSIPESFRLSQNYPNPFNPSTKIRFQLPESRPVELKIFNILGKEVCTLIDKQYEAGYYNVVWDGKDRYGNSVSGGLYIYRIKAGDFMDVKKMLFLK